MYNLLKYFLILSIGLLALLSAVYGGVITATGYQVNLENNSDPLQIIETVGYGPSLVKMNSTLIIVEGAICSCGADHEIYSRNGHVEFENYCPFCQEYSTLIYHTGWYKGTNIVEGEFSCRKCGADFCTAPCAYEKSGMFRKSLIKIKEG